MYGMPLDVLDIRCKQILMEEYVRTKSCADEVELFPIRPMSVQLGSLLMFPMSVQL